MQVVKNRRERATEPLSHDPEHTRPTRAMSGTSMQQVRRHGVLLFRPRIGGRRESDAMPGNWAALCQYGKFYFNDRRTH